MTHWIILPVILPAMVAPLIVLLARHDLTAQRALSVLSAIALAVLALGLFTQASHQPPQLYRLGDWPAPFGIVLVLDRLAALMLILTAALSLAVLAHAIATGWDARGKHFHALFQFQLMGLNGAFLTGDAFNLFVFFEVLLIASYGLMIHAGGGDRLRAGVQYVALNLIGSTLFLFALATIYGVTGTLNMADLSVKIAALPPGDHALIRVAVVLLLAVFALKGALVPLQFWLPGTYANAPGPVAALFAVMTKVGAYAILRTTTLIAPPQSAAITDLPQTLLIPAAAVTLALGAIGVLGAASLPRLAAFAGIASMGTLFLALGQGTPQATAAGLYYLIHSTLASAAVFLLVDLILARRGSAALSPRPAMPQHGALALCYFAVALALAGLPPLSGFIGKLLVLDALRGHPLLWALILGTSFLMILGLARAGSTLFWSTPPDNSPPTRAPAELAAFSGLAALLMGIVALTVFAGPLAAWIEVTATELHSPATYIRANQLGAAP